MNDNMEAYVFQLKDDYKLKNSASGGFFSALCKYVIKNNGVVFGAVYTENFTVKHVAIDNLEDCLKFSGSKYVQSDLGDTFRQVKGLLEQGRLVCFSGMGCQIAGLINYLGKQYKNLITVDLICAGVPSPLLWSRYIEYQENRYKSRLHYVNFRNKTYGYQCSTMFMEFDNGKVYSYSGRIDPMMKFFVNGIAKRPSCYECKIKGIQRNSDFTIFDSWNAEKLTGYGTNDRGYTNVLIQSAKAKELFPTIASENMAEAIDIDRAVLLDGKMVMQQPNKHEKREEFYRTLRLEGFNECVNRYIKITFKDMVLEKIKPVLYRTGLISKVKQVKKILK